jgi:hypothetical protein
MKKLLAFFVALIIVGFSGCGGETKPGASEEPGLSSFLVETDFEYQYEKNGYHRYVVMPKIAESVVNGEAINETISISYNTLQELKDSEAWMDWPPGDSFKRYYTVSRQSGICGLHILLENLKEGGNATVPEDYYVTTVESYYYDENTQKVLSQEEYLAGLGYTEEDILNLFKKEYGERYSNRTYDFQHMVFWFDEKNRLQFSAYYIDQMDSNSADFALVIDGEAYPTGVSDLKHTPFGEAIKSEEKFYGDVWAGSWWVEEHYDGAYVLYSLHKQTKRRYPFHIDITKGNDETAFKVYTYRGAAIGDTKARVLALYPEIDPEKAWERYNRDNLLVLEGNGGYFYLEFHFEDDVVVQLSTGTLID